MLELSIITVTYNDFHALVKTTESIEKFLNLRPKYNKFIEHVIVDGNSEDDTLQFLGNVNTSRIRQVISESDHGIYDAMNKGIKLARGRFIVFLNAGDEISMSFPLEHFFSACQQLESDRSIAGIAYSAIMRFKKRDFVVKARLFDGRRPRMPTIHQSIFYKKEVLDKYPYDTNFRICGDYDNCLKIYSAGYYFKFSPEIFSIFYAGGTSSNNLMKLYKESTLATKIHLNPPLLLSCWIKFRLITSLILMKIFLRIFKVVS